MEESEHNSRIEKIAEMIYDEGYRGNNVLETSSKFLTENLGVSSLILRSLIFLDGK